MIQYAKIAVIITNKYVRKKFDLREIISNIRNPPGKNNNVKVIYGNFT